MGFSCKFPLNQSIEIWKKNNYEGDQGPIFGEIGQAVNIDCTEC